MNQIKAIFFDAGGVLFNTNPDYINDKFFEKFGFSPFLFSELSETLAKQYDYELSIGKKSYKEELFNEGKVKRENQQTIYNTYKELYLESQQIDKEIEQLIRGLSLNYSIYCLTNTADTPLEINRKSRVFSVFDKVYGSCEMGVKKPDKEAFLYPLRELNLKPEEIIFIDDSSKNVIAAEALGIKSILFENYSQLKRDLKKLNIIR